MTRRAVFALDSERRRQLVEVFSYIEARHHYIDPDMYDIDLNAVEALKRIVGDGEDEASSTISMSYDQVNVLETCVMAADTYAHRKGERDLCRLTDFEFAGLDAWVRAVRSWFVA